MNVIHIYARHFCALSIYDCIFQLLRSLKDAMVWEKRETNPFVTYLMKNSIQFFLWIVRNTFYRVKVMIKIMEKYKIFHRACTFYLKPPINQEFTYEIPWAGWVLFNEKHISVKIPICNFYFNTKFTKTMKFIKGNIIVAKFSVLVGWLRSVSSLSWQLMSLVSTLLLEHFSLRL